MHCLGFDVVYHDDGNYECLYHNEITIQTTRVHVPGSQYRRVNCDGKDYSICMFLTMIILKNIFCLPSRYLGIFHFYYRVKWWK